VFSIDPLDVLIIGLAGVWFCLRLSQALDRFVEQLRRDPSEWGRFVLLMRMAEEARDRRRREILRYIRAWRTRFGIALAALLLAISVYLVGGC
jgi:hypothetical protein